MVDMEEYRSPGGLSIDDLAQSSRAILFVLHGKTNCPEWHVTEDEKKDKWRKVAAVAAEQCLREVECSWSSLTERCHAAYHPEASIPFEQMPKVERLIWEAITRNIINMATIEEMNDLGAVSGSESYWADWLIKKTKGEQCGDKVEEEDASDEGYSGSRYE